MTSSELENLVRTGALKREPPAASEVDGLQRSGEARLADADNPNYRPQSRYIVFQALAHTLGMPSATWRVLAKAHDVRNHAEYEGSIDVDERLVADLIDAAKKVRDAFRASKPPSGR
jgi:hypothetical protein